MTARPTYGAPISLDRALALAAAGRVEAEKNSWPVAIAIVDCGGNLVLFAKMDNTQLGSVEIAVAKATTALKFKRATKNFEESLVEGSGKSLKMLAMPGAIPVEGGFPLLSDGKIIGAIGVSGVSSHEDSQIALAAIASADYLQ